ncbi:MAG: long-chain-fatty-acid--CoA ligase [Acidimicrobiales bacterium]
MNIGMIPAKWARQTPDNEAIIDATTGTRVTFAQLDEHVRRLANGLMALGLERGDRVGILSQNSVEYAALYFAAGRCGLITQPLNWRLSAPELARIINGAEPKVFITQGQFVGVADEIMTQVECVEHWISYGEGGDGSYEAMIERASDAEPAGSAELGGDDPLFILYTGGTTGESKGALHTHNSVFHGMLNQTVAERIVPSDVYMLTGQMFHIPVVLAINYLAHGCPLVLMNFDAKLAMELIEKEKVSAFLGVTTMLNWMMAVENFDDYDISSLRNIQYGGGPMPSRVIAEALDKFPCTLIQGYGQTEGTTMCFLSQEDHIRAIGDDYHPERLKSCGREGFISSVRVVDPEGNDVPCDGETAGEIIVKSEANMVGYFRRPDLTAETIKDGWMWTGDMATMDEERYVFIVDRAKDMIISGGENIYSVQVEEAISKHPNVLEVAVIGIPDDEWGESVKAYVVLKPGTEATEQEIIDTARENLASYQKPRSVEFIDSLPKAPTGKILKRDLRAPYWEDNERQV